MKIGFETILWGSRLDDLERTLDEIALAGFQGVEFAQRPDELRLRGSEKPLIFKDLLALLKARNLDLLGFAFGTLKERMEFCKMRGFHGVRPTDWPPEYLYVERWDESAQAAVDAGFKLALHPRAFKAVSNTADALRLQRRHPDLYFLPDTAHLTIAGDSPAEAIRKMKGRLAAVHLKDWSARYGRSCHRHSKGFTELGTGDVDLEGVLKALRRIQFEGWIVAELDNVRSDPEATLRESARWFEERGLLRKKRERLRPEVKRTAFPPKDEADFLRSVMEAALERGESFYHTVAEAFARLIPCHYVWIWSCSPAQDSMGLLAVTPTPPSLGASTHSNPELSLVLKTREALSGFAIDRQAVVTRFRLNSKKPYFDKKDFPGDKSIAGRAFQHSGLIRQAGLTEMVSVPIYTFGNQTYVRLLINLFPKAELGAKFSNSLDDPNGPMQQDLHRFAEAVSSATDSAEEQRCSIATGTTNLLASKHKTKREFLRTLCKLVKKLVTCEGVSIFLVNETKDKLEVGGTTGLGWKKKVLKGHKFYRKGEGITGVVWKRKLPRLSAGAEKIDGFSGKSYEKVPRSPVHSRMWFPFVDRGGEVLAVVRCRDKRFGGTGRGIQHTMFSDDDAALVDAIGQAAVPHLMVILEEERSARDESRRAHKLKSPLNGICTAAKQMAKQMNGTVSIPPDIGTKTRRIWSLASSMRRALKNTDFLRARSTGVNLNRRRCGLFKDVIKPVLEEVKFLLEDRGLLSQHITCQGFGNVPVLRVDVDLLQQAFFNLLSNAITYSGENADGFGIRVRAAPEEGEVIVRVEDNGVGIERNTEERIFEPGVRGRDALGKEASRWNKSGQGLGLWVTRLIVKEHGGSITVESSDMPTTFNISLPLK